MVCIEDFFCGSRRVYIENGGVFRDLSEHRKKLTYFKEQINLFRAICEDSNKEG